VAVPRRPLLPQSGGVTARDVVRGLLWALSSGVPPLQQQLHLVALGHCSKEHYPLLVQELPALIDEYQRPASSRQRARTAGRPEEVWAAAPAASLRPPNPCAAPPAPCRRPNLSSLPQPPLPAPPRPQVRKLVANILRTVADAALPGTIPGQGATLRFYQDWVRDAHAFLRGLPAFSEEFWEASQVRRPAGGGGVGGCGGGWRGIRRAVCPIPMA
jgi:hypothetical protein